MGSDTIPGHHELRIGIRTVNYGFWVRIPHIVFPRKVTYYTYQYVPDKPIGVSDALGMLGVAVKFKPENYLRDVVSLTAISSIVYTAGNPGLIEAIFAGGSTIGLTLTWKDVKNTFDDPWLSVWIGNKMVWPYLKLFN